MYEAVVVQNIQITYEHIRVHTHIYAIKKD